MVIEVTQIEETFVPRNLWFQGGICKGIVDWMEIDEDDEPVQVLDPSNNTIQTTEKKLKDLDALGLSVRRKHD